MAKNFSAGQYESAFRSTMLRNWQIPATKHNQRNKVGLESQKFEPWPSLRHKTRRYRINAISSKNSDYKENVVDNSANATSSAWEKRSSHVPIIMDPAKSSSTSKTINNRCLDVRSQSVPDVCITSTQSEGLHKMTTTSNSMAKQTHVSQPKGDAVDETILLKKVYSDRAAAQNIRSINYKHHALADSLKTSLQQISQPWLQETAAVGCKLYQSPGPTQCSKLKVFRPESKSPATLATPQHEKEQPVQAKSTSTKLLNEIDLAIYWDITADQDDLTETQNLDKHSSRLITQTKRPITCDTATLARTKSTVDLATLSTAAKITKRPHSTDCSKLGTPKVNNFIRPNEPEIIAQGSNDSGHNTVNIELIENENCQSKVKERKTGKLINANIHSANRKETNQYKMAFKAGKPQNFRIDAELLERLAKKRNLRVPKPKIPFAKKSYTIRTLLPPFSIWPRVTGYDYPDHWRLVSVYQQSYKPIEARKTSFMKIIFR